MWFIGAAKKILDPPLFIVRKDSSHSGRELQQATCKTFPLETVAGHSFCSSLTG